MPAVTGRGGRRMSAGRLAMLVGGLLAVVGAVAWMAAHLIPIVAVGRCVSPDPPLAWLGVHLALLQEHPDCSAGQLALDAGPGHAAGLVVMVTVPTLLTNLLTALGAVGWWVALRAVAARAGALLRRLWPVLPTLLRPVVAAGARPVVVQAPLRRPWQLDRSPVVRRGPPASVCW